MVTRNLIIATIAMLIVSVAIGVLFFFAPPGLRTAVRDILLIFLFLLTIFTMLMFLALAIAIFGVLEAFNNRVVPLIDQVSQTTGKVRGTTEFVADEVVRPVISTAGSLARVKAMARAAVGQTSTPPSSALASQSPPIAAPTQVTRAPGQTP